MNRNLNVRGGLLAALLAGGLGLTAQAIPHPDHHEFEAALFAPFRGEDGEARTFKIAFQFPDAPALTVASWRLELFDAAGRSLLRWHGETPLIDGRGWRTQAWDGRDRAGRALPSGFYTLRLTAAPLAESDYRTLPGGDVQHRVEHQLKLAARSDLQAEQATLLVGSVLAPRLPSFDPLPNAAGATAAGRHERGARAATGSLPYTIYYGNLHSQTNHSDGGGPVASCTGAQNPQSGAMGPSDAFEMARVQAGCDFLLASEHNHMYDGSTGTNTSADATAAKALWQSGIDAAASYRAAHPAFLALYGNEWGVISNGGHMNLLNPDGLAGWEYNAGNQLIGHFYTPKSDYAAIYALMQQRGWIGQFNHPQTTGQFAIGGTDLAYDGNGAQVMFLCEVMNTSAFSSNTTETETSRSFYVDAWNILLERGYKLAPSTDQDNHCANWGLSYPNRTAVLLPTGTALAPQAFLDAIKARRVFATMDKTSQLVLTANGHLMGESFSSSGALSLAANWASATAARSAVRVQFFEGVPGRNGTVTQLFEGSGSYTLTPANGDHFYYAVVTQDNGDQLWSAPVWVNQGLGSPDTTPPTVAAAEAGSSGTITLSATASDNVGVTKVEFYVDAILKGSAVAAPYALALDSTALSNAGHSLVAKAYDAAGNVGTSTAVAFTVSNPVATTFNEVEPNDSQAAANVVPDSATKIVGYFKSTADSNDWFAVTLLAGHTLTVDMTGPTASNQDYDLYLYSSAGTQLAASTGSSTTEHVSYKNTNVSAAKTIYVRVNRYASYSSVTPYTLTLSR